MKNDDTLNQGHSYSMPLRNLVITTEEWLEDRALFVHRHADTFVGK